MTITRQRVVRQQGLRALWQENNGHFPVKPLYFLHFAERIHKPSATPTGSHGRWQWSQGAETPHFSRTTAVSPSEPRRKADSLSRCSATACCRDGGTVILLISMDRLRKHDRKTNLFLSFLFSAWETIFGAGTWVCMEKDRGTAS